MEFEWRYSEEGLDWAELSELYKIAPLGEKMPEHLKNRTVVPSGPFVTTHPESGLYQTGDRVLYP